MTIITRRGVVALGGGVAAGFAIGGRSGRAAELPLPKLEVEKGASLRVLRPAKFVEGDQVKFDENSKRFSDTYGIPVRVDYLAWENLPPQTAVVANTGAGPDIVIGFGPDPQLYTTKLVELTDVAEHLGQKYGGWFQLSETYGKKWKTNNWIGIPFGGTAGPAVYRMSWVKEAGFDAIPTGLDDFLKLCQGLKKIGHPCGFSLGHAVGDANGYATFLLWSHGAQVADEDGKVALDSAATREACEYAKAMQATMIDGTLSWLDPSNNKAYAAGQIGLTSNGVSIYYAAKTSQAPEAQAIAADTNHGKMPIGKGRGVPTSATVMNAMLFQHSKFPNAAKQYLTFMMEQDQYDPWLTASLGYWSEPLRAYAASKVWDSDPKLSVFRTSMDTPFYEGYAGPVSESSGTVYADFVLVDMFARVVTGESSVEDSVRTAVRAVRRYYK